jgi:hypothetical protein
MIILHSELDAKQRIPCLDYNIIHDRLRVIYKQPSPICRSLFPIPVIHKPGRTISIKAKPTLTTAHPSLIKNNRAIGHTSNGNRRVVRCKLVLCPNLLTRHEFDFEEGSIDLARQDIGSSGHCAKVFNDRLLCELEERSTTIAEVL